MRYNVTLADMKRSRASYYRSQDSAYKNIDPDDDLKPTSNNDQYIPHYILINGVAMKSKGTSTIAIFQNSKHASCVVEKLKKLEFNKNKNFTIVTSIS